VIGVAYAFPSSVPPPCWASQSIIGLGINGDIDSSFTQWTNADQTQNSSNVTFYSSPEGPFRVYAQSVVDPSGCGVSVAAQTNVGIYQGTMTVAAANTTFYLGSSSQFGPNYDPNAGNYHSFIQKLMTHEIGHTMGLDNQLVGGGVCGGQIAGESVMNAQCGTNDSANNLPAPMVGLPTCDNQSIP
jgi:hypothetical protein